LIEFAERDLSVERQSKRPFDQRAVRRPSNRHAPVDVAAAARQDHKRDGDQQRSQHRENRHQ
jgi:hypothetical protein